MPPIKIVFCELLAKYKALYKKGIINPAVPNTDRIINKLEGLRRIGAALRVSKNPGVVKGRRPLSFIPALTACTSERMKTSRFSYLAGFAARER